MTRSSPSSLRISAVTRVNADMPTPLFDPRTDRSTGNGSVHPFVRRQGQEVGVLVGDRDLEEGLLCLLVVCRVSGQLGDLLLDHPVDELTGDRGTGVGERDVVVQPLPHLAPGD